MISKRTRFETHHVRHGRRKFESSVSWKRQDFCNIVEKAFYACKGVDHIAFKGGTKAYFPVFIGYSDVPFVGSVSLKDVRKDALVFEATFPDKSHFNSLKLKDVIDLDFLYGDTSDETLANYEKYRDDYYFDKGEWRKRNVDEDICDFLHNCPAKTEEIIINFLDLFYDLGLDDNIDVTFDLDHKPLVSDEYDIKDFSSYAVESLKQDFQDYFNNISSVSEKTYKRLRAYFDDIIWAENDRLSHLDYTV